MNREDGLKVATDILRQLGHEDMAKWIEHPTAVRILLAVDPHGDGERCESCDADTRGPHETHCQVAIAWWVLGDLRAQKNIERAHEVALEMNRCLIHDDGNLARCVKTSRHKGRCDFNGRSDTGRRDQ